MDMVGETAADRSAPAEHLSASSRYEAVLAAFAENAVQTLHPQKDHLVDDAALSALSIYRRLHAQAALNPTNDRSSSQGDPSAPPRQAKATTV